MKNQLVENGWPIPVDAQAIRDSKAGSAPSSEIAARNLSYLHAAIDELAAWAAMPDHPGAGLGLLAPPGTFAETPQARYRRMARELYDIYGPDAPVAELLRDKSAILEALGLPSFCPSGKAPGRWCGERFAAICKQYEALQADDAAKLHRAACKANSLRTELAEQGDGPDADTLAALRRLDAKCRQNGFYYHGSQAPAFQTKMVRANATEKHFFIEPFFAGKENQFLCLNGFLGRGREYQPATSGSKWNPCNGLWRDANHCGCLHACYVDLDCYKCGFANPEQVAAYYNRYIDGVWLPPCSAIVISGYGCYIIWFFGVTDLEENGWQLLDAHTRVEQCLAAMLANLGADPAATDVARVLRIPGSVHHKDGKAPRPVYVWRLAGQAGAPCYAYKDALAFFRAMEDYTGTDFVPDSVLPHPERAAPAAQNPYSIVLPSSQSNQNSFPTTAGNGQNSPSTGLQKPFCWDFHAEPELLPGDPVNLHSLAFIPGCPPQYYWLTQAVPYCYRRGGATPSLSARQAHDMAILLLYFEKGTDYASRHLAIFWLAQFLRNARAEQKEQFGTEPNDGAICQFVWAVCHQMKNPLADGEIAYILSRPSRLLHIKSNRLITELKISPRTQPYMQAILYEAEAKRRTDIRRREYEAYRKPRRGISHTGCRKLSRHQQAVAGRAERRSQAAAKAALALFAVATGASERDISKNCGITKGKASRLHRAYTAAKEAVCSGELHGAELAAYLAEKASENGLSGDMFVQAAKLAAEHYEVQLHALQASAQDAQRTLAQQTLSLKQSLLTAQKDIVYTKQCRQDVEASEKQFESSPAQDALPLHKRHQYLADAYATNEIDQDFVMLARNGVEAAQGNAESRRLQCMRLEGAASFFQNMSPT